MNPENFIENLTLILQNPYRSKDYAGTIQPFLRPFQCLSRRCIEISLLLYCVFSDKLNTFLNSLQIKGWSRGVAIIIRTDSGFHTVDYVLIVAPPVGQLEAFTINFTEIVLKKGGQKFLWA